MSLKCQTIINIIENIAPKKLAEEWDNVGLQVGSSNDDISAILFTLDVTEPVVEEAIQLGANLIVAHHPLIFKPLKNLRTDLSQGRILTKMIQNQIAVYCAHTNLDSAKMGVNQTLAELLNLQDIKVLNPDKMNPLYKVVVFAPATHGEQIRQALTNAGAGWIGNYSDCTFMSEGTGTFKALEGTNPYLGQVGKTEFAEEVRIETIVGEKQVEKVLNAVFRVHPYEEVAYDVIQLANKVNPLGLGRIGSLADKTTLQHFIDTVKSALGIQNLRFVGNLQNEVNKVAVCGGSGASLIHKAAFMGADVLVTGDLKYHEAQEALNLGLNVIDAGHFATENPVMARLAQFVSKNLEESKNSVPVFESEKNRDVFEFI